MNKRLWIVILSLVAVSALSGCMLDGVVDEVIDEPARMISVTGAAAVLPGDSDVLSFCGTEGFNGAYCRKVVLLTGIPYETELKEIRWDINGHVFMTDVDVFIYPFLEIGWIPFNVVIVDALGRETTYAGEILVRNRSDYFSSP